MVSPRRFCKSRLQRKGEACLQVSTNFEFPLACLGRPHREYLCQHAGFESAFSAAGMILKGAVQGLASAGYGQQRAGTQGLPSFLNLILYNALD